jgi:hypothetical protein
MQRFCQHGKGDAVCQQPRVFRRDGEWIGVHFLYRTENMALAGYWRGALAGVGYSEYYSLRARTTNTTVPSVLQY